MNERDIPSVPITTLAGVASLTDCEYVSYISCEYMTTNIL